MKFRKKPVVIEAVQLKLEMPRDEMPEWFTYAADHGTIDIYTLELIGGDEAEATISTLEGEMIAAQGDWIIQGIKGELYPCKPDIFEATYEAVKFYGELPEQDEPVDISEKFEPTVAAVLPNGVRVTNVYEAYEVGLKEWRSQDEKPVAYLYDLDTYFDHQPAYDVLSKKLPTGTPAKYLKNVRPLYLCPAPRKPFVRLSEEEVNEILSSAHTPYEAICAVENRLAEKNK